MRFSQLRSCCAGFQTSHDSKLHRNCSFPFFYVPRYITTLPFDADCAFGARVCRSLEGAFVLGIFNCYFHVHCHLKEITQRGRLTLTSHFSIFNHFTIALWLEQQKEILPTIYFVFVLFFISITIHTEYMYIQCYVGL